ncbi:hypothetical protein GCM10010420_55650 [Streptomyces glaucosporus]|uniref:Secreted protein n=1 Tax=Streptomyces glaucosporus TaxID=284044 RepID=A0ABP5W3W3_9ACTN
MNARSHPLHKRAAISAAAGALSLATVVATGSSAHAATSWSATGTQADVVGAYAYGTIDNTNTHTIVRVVIRDSVSDGASARVYFRWRYGEGSTSGAYTLTASGYMAENSKTYSIERGRLDSWDPFEVMECKVDNGEEVDCGGWDTPFQ